MAARDPLPHFGRIDFLAVVVPGFYVLANLWLVGLAFTYRENEDLWQAVQAAVQTPTENWTVFLGIILTSYLLGSLLRAVPVNAADRAAQLLLAPLRLVLGLLPWLRAYGLRFEPFPYRSILKDTLDNVASCGGLRGLNDPAVTALREAVKVPDPTQEFSAEALLHTAYNYWKVVVCDRAPGAFEFSQELESRVRLFAGMFWAGLLGIVLLVGGFWAAGLRGYLSEWRFWAALAVSAAIGVGFGLNVGRVRREEVRHVFLAYLTLLRP
jgi:cytochrome bd-type quinol oxidase subunit 2